MPINPNPVRIAGLFAGALALAACSSAYYKTMEMFGYQKRDLLVDRVEDARADQAAAKEQFQTTFAAFKKLTSFDGGELETVYEELKDEFEECKDSAAAVGKRIASIESVSADLFSEWQSEIEQISSPEIQRKSSKLMADTKSSYEGLITAMKSAEAKMSPVLNAFNDHVLLLKHNLNAQAISSLQDTVVKIESEVAALVREMESSIDRADEFIQSMES